MKRILMLITIMCSCASAFSQDVRADRIIADRGLFPPYLDTGSVNPTRIGQLTIRPADYLIYRCISLTPGTRRWSAIASDDQVWKKGGNVGTNAGPDFIGTIDPQKLIFKTKNLFAAAIDTNQNFGIGITTPTAKLHVVPNMSTGSYFKIGDWSSDAGYLTFLGNGGTEFPGQEVQINANPEEGVYLKYQSGADVSDISINGSLAINSANDITIQSNSTLLLQPYSGLTTIGSGGTPTKTLNLFGSFKNELTGEESDAFTVYSQAGGENLMRIDNDLKNVIFGEDDGTYPNVGIGVSIPETKFQVNGTLRFTGISEGSGKVLTSDASGNASWQNVSISLSAIGSSPNANGATFSGGSLNLQPASASFGGVVTTGTQTFAGAKTFNSDIVANGITVGRGPGNIATNTAVGLNALLNNGSANYNTAVGNEALYSNTSGFRNTAVGYQASYSHSSGQQITAVGYQALYNNTANGNTAVGSQALYTNTTSLSNTAIGGTAAYYTNSANNTAVGTGALYQGGGGFNTAVGRAAMSGLGIGTGSFTGYSNTGVGANNMAVITTGFQNASLGAGAFEALTTGQENTAVGYDAGLLTTTGYRNVFAGWNARAGDDGYQNVNLGYGGGFSLSSGNHDNIFIGPFSGYNGSQKTDAVNSIAIGSGTYTTADNQTVIGNTSTTETIIRGAINARWKARVGSTTSSGTPTINTDSYDIYKITAQAAAITSFTTNLSGTPNDGDILEVQITDDGTARAITWGSSFVSSSVTLPTTTTISTTLTVIFQYYTTSSYGNNKWVCVNYY